MQAGNIGEEGCIYRVLLVMHTLSLLCLSLSVSLFAVWQSRRQKERDVIYIFMYR